MISTRALRETARNTRVSLAKVALEPFASEVRDLFQGAGFFEQMRGVRDDLEAGYRADAGLCLTVEIENNRICATHNQQHGCVDLRKHLAGEVGTATACDYSRDTRGLGGCDQSGSGSSAGAEVAEAEVAHLRIICEPCCGVDKTLGEKIDIESKMAGALVERFFHSSEQVEQEGGKARFLQGASDELVARTVPAAAASVRENHRAARRGGNAQIAFQRHAAGTDADATGNPAAVR